MQLSDDMRLPAGAQVWTGEPFANNNRRTVLSNFAAFWHASRSPEPSFSPHIFARRCRFVRRAQQASATLAPLLDALGDARIARSVTVRSELLTLFEAPYINVHWDAATRITSARRHLDVAARFALLNFNVEQSVCLLDLDIIGPGLHLVLDKPQFFSREGVATLNLFHENTRLFCLSFALDACGDALVAVIGGIQGRKLPAILDVYRDFTKRSHGVRPRDFIVEVFRMICAALGVTQIKAVSDLCRHHRSTYFRLPIDRQMPLDYDAIWIERGGIAIDDAWWDIPLARPDRDNIPAKKRALYRARYAMFDDLAAAMPDAVRRAVPVYQPKAL